VSRKTNAVIAVLLIGFAITAFNYTSTTGGDQLNSLQANSDNPNETIIQDYIPFLSSIETCAFGEYDRCIEDTYEYETVRSVSILAYESYSNPSTEDSLNYECAIGEKAYLLNEPIDDINNVVSDWENLEVSQGEEVSLEGEIPFTEISDGYSLLCLNHVDDGTYWASNGVSLSNDGFDLSEPEPKVSTYRETDVDSGEEQVEATVYLENTGSDMTSDWIVEMQPVQQEALSFLSFVGRQSTCDSENPQNVNKPFSLDSGDRESITLRSDGLEAGTYAIKMVSTTGCAVDNPDAQAVEPFGWGDVVEQDVFVEEINDPPVINSLDVLSSGTVGEPVSVSVSASDPNGDELGIEWSNGDSGESSEYVFDSAGEKQVSVTVSDSSGLTDSESATVDVVQEFVRWLPPESGDQCVEKVYNDESNIPDEAFQSESECVESLSTGFFQKIIDFFTGLFG